MANLTKINKGDRYETPSAPTTKKKTPKATILRLQVGLNLEQVVRTKRTEFAVSANRKGRKEPRIISLNEMELVAMSGHL